MVVQVISLGGALTSITVPDRDGKMADILLGFDDVQGQLHCSAIYAVNLTR